MIRVMAAAVVWVALAVGVSAQGREIEAAIGGQIEAMRGNDFATAFAFASPGIRDRFGSAAAFEAMVRGGYPMVWKPRAIRFLDLREGAGVLWQKVLVTDAQGRAHLLDYQMVELDGGWKINAVHLLSTPPPGV